MKLKDDLRLEDFIRNVPDFPEKGIQFKDITPLLGRRHCAAGAPAASE